MREVDIMVPCANLATVQTGRMSDLRDQPSYLGMTTFHRRFIPFGIRQADRLSHVYLIGKTGVGKSTMLEHLARQDLAAGRGFALIDPHGDLVERLRAETTSRDDVVYFDATDPHQPFGYNPLRRVPDNRIPVAVSGFLEALKKLWPEAWGVRMEHVLRNSLFTLLERNGSTLPDILRLFGDAAYLKEVVVRIRNPVVKTFWTTEFAKYPDRYRAEIVAPIQNKLGALLTDPRLYRALVTPEQPISFRKVMDQGGVLLVNLAKGRLGEDGASVLGGLIAATIGLAALSRADGPTQRRRPFHVYIDEFQTFTTLSFVNMLPELRKYGVSLTLAHQYLHQLDSDIRHAVLGNAGTLISFRVGPEDASVMATEFQPKFDVLDLISLPNRDFYLTLMIDGAPSKPFSARTLNP